MGQNEKVTLSEKGPTIQSNEYDNPSSIPTPSAIQSTLSVLSDLDVPIALRNCVWSCTKYPNANFTSYKKLSNSHTSRIDDLFVPKKIHGL